MKNLNPSLKLRRFPGLLFALITLFCLLSQLPASAQTTWDCGGEGEIPCGCKTDFFWENGNLFADRGLIATGFRVLPPIRFNASEWANLNRADLELATDLMQRRIPALQQKLTSLSASDFLKSVCAGVEAEGQCWTTPPLHLPGKKLFGECRPIFPGEDPDCTITIPGTPSFEFDYFPDFNAPGWTIVNDMNSLMNDLDRVLARLPNMLRVLPGNVPSFTFPRPSVGIAVNINSFRDSVSAFKSFFSANNVFFTTFQSMILDFTSPPTTARCINDTRSQPIPAAFNQTWTSWAFQTQQDWSKDEPFNWASTLGTHNAFNNSADGYLAPNQHWSITDQLNLGSRWIALDPHWFEGRLRLSHAKSDHQGASKTDRFYCNAIKEIATWVRNHRGEIVIIGFEDRSDDHASALLDPLQRYLGDLIYRVGESSNPWLQGGFDFAGQWPSKQQMRDAGKQVIVMGPFNYDSDLIWPDVPSPGFTYSRAKTFKTSGLGGTAYGQTDTEIRQIGPFDNITLGTQYESRSLLDIFDPSGFLTAAGLQERIGFNIAEISLDMLYAQQFSAQCPDLGTDICGSPDNRIDALIWSWAPGQPEDWSSSIDNGESTAVLRSTDGRWESRSSNESHPFACVRMRGLDPLRLPDRLGADWKITSRSGKWDEGFAACEELNAALRSNGIDDDGDGDIDEADEGDYVFGAPVNGWQNARLRLQLGARMQALGLPYEEVWLACHDRVQQGQWRIERSFPETVGHPSFLRFNGQQQSVSVSSMGLKMPTDEITIEFWQRVSEVREQVSFSIVHPNNAKRVLIHAPWVDGRVYWDFGDISQGLGRLSYVPPVSIVGTWQHFALVASKRGNYMKIFRNGVQEAFKSGMTPFEKADLPLFFATAQDFDSGAFSAWFKGDLDEFRIWNAALTETQVRSNLLVRLQGNEPGLVAYWRLDSRPDLQVREEVAGYHGTRWEFPFWINTTQTPGSAYAEGMKDERLLLYHRMDETNGATLAFDSSGRALHGSFVETALGGSSYSPQMGRSVRFPGPNSCVRLKNVGIRRNWTMTFWLQTPAQPSTGGLFETAGGSAEWLALRLLNTGALEVNAGDSGGLYVLPKSEAQSWHNLTLTYNASTPQDQLTLYWDGRFVGSQSQRSAVGIRFEGACLGNMANGNQQFAGALDEWALFERTLTASEIRFLHGKHLASPVTGLVHAGATGLPQMTVEQGYHAPARQLEDIPGQFPKIGLVFTDKLRWLPGQIVPVPGAPTNHLAAEITGVLFNPVGDEPLFSTSTTIELELNLTGAARVWIEDQLIFDLNQVGPYRQAKRTLIFNLGTHPIRIQYLVNNGPFALSLDARSIQPVSASFFSHDFYDVRWLPIGQTTTDVQGRFTFDKVPPGATIRPLQANADWIFLPSEVEFQGTNSVIDFDAIKADQPPRLLMVAESDAIQIQWPTLYENYQLEESSKLDDSTTRWQTVNAPVQLTNGYRVVRVPKGTESRFYRLIAR